MIIGQVPVSIDDIYGSNDSVIIDNALGVLFEEDNDYDCSDCEDVTVLSISVPGPCILSAIIFRGIVRVCVDCTSPHLLEFEADSDGNVIVPFWVPVFNNGATDMNSSKNPIKFLVFHDNGSSWTVSATQTVPHVSVPVSFSSIQTLMGTESLPRPLIVQYLAYKTFEPFRAMFYPNGAVFLDYLDANIRGDPSIDIEVDDPLTEFLLTLEFGPFYDSVSDFFDYRVRVIGP